MSAYIIIRGDIIIIMCVGAWLKASWRQWRV